MGELPFVCQTLSTHADRTGSAVSVILTKTSLADYAQYMKGI
jgi:hypothetical protein